MSDLLFRQGLEEKLNGIIVDLNTDRGLFSHNSKKFDKLKDAIDDVMGFLKDHSGEEWLEKDDKKALEEKIHLMQERALPYMRDKLKKGALADGAPNSLRKRYWGAYCILRIPTRVPDDPREEYGLVRPMELEKGDEEYKDWAHRYKQNISYTAKKQIFTYKQNLKKHDAVGDKTGKLTSEEFIALMDFMEVEKILTYKDDAELCQKYPTLRLKLELAIRAKEKLQNLDNKQIEAYLFDWGTEAAEKAVEAARKAKERKKQPFTEKEKQNVLEKVQLFITDRVEEFKNKNALIEKGDVLEQVARYFDLKMNVMTNKNYVKLFHTNSLGKTYSTSDYEKLIKRSKDPDEKEYYQNLRDIRELEECGISHIREPYEKTYYKEVEETLHTTVKREILGVKIGKFGLKGASALNNAFGAEDSSTTIHAIGFGRGLKGRVGKIGYKLHTKHKTLSASGGLVFGQAKAGGSIGASYVTIGANAMADGEFASMKARGKLKLDTKAVKASIGGSISTGYTSGYAKGGLGHFVQKDNDGKDIKVYGVYGKAGYTFAAYKGDVGGSLNILGLKFSVSLTGYGGGIGGEFGGGLTSGNVMFSFAGALGIGAGLAVNVNWSGLTNNIRNLWRKNKLRKLISAYKEKKKESSLEAINPEKGKGGEDKKETHLNDPEENVIPVEKNGINNEKGKPVKKNQLHI